MIWPGKKYVILILEVSDHVQAVIRMTLPTLGNQLLFVIFKGWYLRSKIE